MKQNEKVNKRVGTKALRNTAHFAATVSTSSALIAAIFGAILTIWAPITGLILALIAGGVATIFLLRKITTEQTLTAALKEDLELDQATEGECRIQKFQIKDQHDLITCKPERLRELRQVEVSQTREREIMEADSATDSVAFAR